MTDTNTPTGVHGQQGAVSPEQLKQLTTELLTTLRQDINAAITTRLGGRGGDDDLREQIKGLADKVQSLASAGNGQPNGAAGNGKNQGDEELRAQLDDLKGQLQQRDKQLLTEKKTAAIRDSLVRAGVRPDSLDDAMQLLSGRDDIALGKDGQGNPVWQGRVKGQLGDMVEADLDKVATEFLSTRPGMKPAQGAGGSGATGGTTTVPGLSKPLEQMSQQELEALPREQLDAAWAQGGGDKAGAGFFS